MVNHGYIYARIDLVRNGRNYGMLKTLNVHFVKKDIRNILMIIVSSFLYAYGLQTFVKWGNLYPSGFAGISRLVIQIIHDMAGVEIPFALVYFGLNIFVTILVWKRIGHKFILFSFLWYSLASFFTAFMNFNVITNDQLLIAVFGGILNGISIGLALNANASSGGTDFIAIDLSARLNRPTWNYILFINALVLAIAGIRSGWSLALYSIIFQFASTQVVNAMYSRYKLSRMEIITDYPEDVSQRIFRLYRHGITQIQVLGVYKHRRHSLLMLTVNQSQVANIVKAVKKVDPMAFVTVYEVEKVIGNFYQQPVE